MEYKPGLHIIATIDCKSTGRLRTYEPLKAVTDALINHYGLHKLGEVYHNFQPAGFTAVVCLSESHLSIHTWPEYGKVNLDIYLSNFQKENDGTTEAIFNSLCNYFEGTITQQQTIRR